MDVDNYDVTDLDTGETIDTNDAAKKFNLMGLNRCGRSPRSACTRLTPPYFPLPSQRSQG